MRRQMGCGDQQLEMRPTQLGRPLAAVAQYLLTISLDRNRTEQNNLIIQKNI